MHPPAGANIPANPRPHGDRKDDLGTGHVSGAANSRIAPLDRGSLFPACATLEPFRSVYVLNVWPKPLARPRLAHTLTARPRPSGTHRQITRHRRPLPASAHPERKPMPSIALRKRIERLEAAARRRSPPLARKAVLRRVPGRHAPMGRPASCRRRQSRVDTAARQAAVRGTGRRARPRLSRR